jgi:quercetin dioxygenase-like cupin family protein
MQVWDTRALQVERHRPEVLRSDDEGRAITIHLAGGDQLQEHQVHERAYLIVVEGEVAIEHDAEVVEGGSGMVVHFEPNERRAVTALKDSRLVLILVPWPGEGHPSQR